jgi:hypothetical protein
VILRWGGGGKRGRGGDQGSPLTVPSTLSPLLASGHIGGGRGGEGGGGLVSSTEPVGEGCTPVVDTE